METLRDKSKRLFKQVQSDTDEALKAKLLGTCRIDIEEDYKTAIDVAMLSLNDDIQFVKNRLEKLVSNPNLRPDTRKDVLDIIARLA